MTMTATLDFAPTPAPDRAPFTRSTTRYSDVRADRLDQVRRMRRLAIGVALGLAMLAIALGFGGGAAATAPTIAPAEPATAVESELEVYVVQPGDTLWEIADRIVPAGADLRPIVDYLRDVAGGTALDVGQRITIDHARIRT